MSLRPILKLRHLKLEDYKNLRKFVINKKVANYLTWEAYKEEVDVKKYFKKILKKNSYPDETLAIDFNSKLIGTVHIISRGNKITQIGFGLLPGLWNKGLGLISLSLILTYIKEGEWINNSEELWADVNKLNRYAIRLLLKSDFILTKLKLPLNRCRYIYKI